MILASNLTGARIVLWPGTANDCYGFGMDAGTYNYYVPSTATHKFYCGTTVYVSIASGATTTTGLLVVPTLSLVEL